jgi:hypothetical protein
MVVVIVVVITPAEQRLDPHGWFTSFRGSEISTGWEIWAPRPPRPDAVEGVDPGVGGRVAVMGDL